MSITNKFNFVGTVLVPKENSKMPFFKEIDKKKKMASINFGIKESDNNMAFVEAFDGTQETILTMNTDNEKIEVPWEDRFNESVVDMVANYKKFTIDLGDDFGGRKEFVSLYDAIFHMKEWLPKYKGKIMATGQFVKEYDTKRDQYFDKFKVQNIYAVDDEVKSRLSLTIDFYYNKDSVDKTDFKDEKKIYLNGYINQYINKTDKNKYIPHQLVFNASKFNLDNEKHKAKYDYKMRYIDVSSKTIVHIPWEIVLLRGAEGVEFNESMLTKAQKEQIELGIKELNDFKPRGQIFGDKINEYRLFDPVLKDFGDDNNFSDGLVDTKLKMAEFEESIYVPKAKDEKLEDIVKEANKEEVKKESSTKENNPVIEDDDLF